MAPSHDLSPRASEDFLKRTLYILKFTSTDIYNLRTHQEIFLHGTAQIQLPSTNDSKKHIMDRKEKRATIWENFYCTEAMMTR